jgi:hypothetical protein
MELSKNELWSIFECISTVENSSPILAAEVFRKIVRCNTRLEPIAKAVWEDKFKCEVPWSQDL